MVESYSQQDNHDSVAFLVEQIKKRRLLTPALLFLEMHRPLQTLAHSGALLAEPILNMLVGPDLMQNALRVLGTPEEIDRLIDMLRAVEEEGVG